MSIKDAFIDTPPWEELSPVRPVQQAVPFAAVSLGMPSVPPTISGAVLVALNALEAQLKTLAETHRATAFDVTTYKGLAAAKAARHELREQGRFAVQRMREELKKKLNGAKSMVETRADELIAITQPVEDSIDKQITAEETRLAAIAAENARLEKERRDKFLASIESIRGYAAQARGLPSDKIATGIAVLQVMAIGTETFAEFTEQAENARQQTLHTLRGMHEAAVAREAEQAEAARVKAENEELRARLAAAEAKIVAPLVAAAQEMVDCVRVATGAVAGSPAAAATEQWREVGPAAFGFGTVIERVPPPVQIVDVEPMLTLACINGRLGFDLSVGFITGVLGFEFADDLLPESQFEQLCDVLVGHIGDVAGGAF